MNEDMKMKRYSTKIRSNCDRKSGENRTKKYSIKFMNKLKKKNEERSKERTLWLYREKKKAKVVYLTRLKHN